jgi:hypothetical protein
VIVVGVDILGKRDGTEQRDEQNGEKGKLAHAALLR